MKSSRIILFFLSILFSLAVLNGCSIADSKKNSEGYSQTVQAVNFKCPWEERGTKQPSEYTWEEFEALTEEQQELFFEWFDSAEEFEKWMNEAERAELYRNQPWNNGGKTPSEYTWEEFEALTEEQQELFFEWFGNVEDFDKWLTANNP